MSCQTQRQTAYDLPPLMLPVEPSTSRMSISEVIGTLSVLTPIPAPAPLPPLVMMTSPSPMSSLTKAGANKVFRFPKRSVVDTPAEKEQQTRRSRLVFDFTEQEMAKYYHMPQREAAKHLGVAVITVKRNCKRQGIKWPYREAKLRESRAAKAKPSHRSQQRRQRLEPQFDSIVLLSEAARAFSRLPLDCTEEDSVVNM